MAGTGWPTPTPTTSSDSSFRTSSPTRAGMERRWRSAEQAAETLRRWTAEGVLVRDDQPALWLYEMRPPDGQPETTGWLGAVALPPPGSAAVLPHEDTYAPAVEGRRALLAATATDLEPIVLAHDPEPEISDLTGDGRGRRRPPSRSRTPTVSGTGCGG